MLWAVCVFIHGRPLYFTYSQEGVLELTTAKGASYQLAADSGAECHAWVSSIQARARLASEATTTRAAWLHMLGGAPRPSFR